MLKKWLYYYLIFSFITSATLLCGGGVFGLTFAYDLCELSVVRVPFLWFFVYQRWNGDTTRARRRSHPHELNLRFGIVVHFFDCVHAIDIELSRWIVKQLEATNTPWIRWGETSFGAINICSSPRIDSELRKFWCEFAIDTRCHQEHWRDREKMRLENEAQQNVKKIHFVIIRRFSIEWKFKKKI